jgi:hypothetical protein
MSFAASFASNCLTNAQGSAPARAKRRIVSTGRRLARQRCGNGGSSPDAAVHLNTHNGRSLHCCVDKILNLPHPSVRLQRRRGTAAPRMASVSGAGAPLRNASAALRVACRAQRMPARDNGCAKHKQCFVRPRVRLSRAPASRRTLAATAGPTHAAMCCSRLRCARGGPSPPRVRLTSRL